MQADICRTVLTQELMKVCRLLGKDQDASGGDLDDEGRYGLVRFSMELQTTLLALGRSSEELARIVKQFSAS
jgi:hypothetical protein